MANDIIRYDLLVQDAMRGVMRKVLGDVAERGLPGEHHFTISFRTDAEGVTISRRLKEQWPRELTIILQHQYTNLEVDENGFGVTLSFRLVPEDLYIPFSAVTGFFDPAVEFGLRFEDADEDDAGEDLDADEDGDEAPGRKGPSLVKDSAPAPLLAPVREETPAPAGDKTRPDTSVETADGESDGAKVVSIDAFRKKT